MPDEQNKNINLLPGDLKKKRDAVIKVISIGAEPVETGNAVDIKEDHKLSLWRRLFGKNKTLDTLKPKPTAGSSESPASHVKDQVTRAPHPNPLPMGEGGRSADLPTGTPLPSGLFARSRAYQEKNQESTGQIQKKAFAPPLKSLFRPAATGSVLIGNMHRGGERGLAKAKNPVRPKGVEFPAKSTKGGQLGGQGNSTPNSSKSGNSVERPAAAATAPREQTDPEPEVVIDFLHGQKISAVPTQTPKPAEAPAKPIPAKKLSLPTLKKEPPKLEKTNSQFTDAPIRAPEGFAVNLLTREYAKAFDSTNPKVLLATAAGFTVVFILFLYAAFHLYATKNSQDLAVAAQENQALSAAINSYAELVGEDESVRSKVAVLRTLLDNHLSWRNFLTELEKVTIPEVAYTGIVASREGSVALGALARDYTALARQLTVLENEADWIEAVGVTGASLAKDNMGRTQGVEFDINLKVKKEVFGIR